MRHIRGVCPDTAVVVVVVMVPPRLVPVTVVSVVVRIPVVVITVVMVPVEWSPGMPVNRVVTPVPVGAPDYVVRTVDEPDYRPGCYLVVGGCNNSHIVPLDGAARITRVGRFRIVWFYDVIFAVKSLITYKLYLNLSVSKLLNGENCHILVLVAVKNRTEDYRVDIPAGVIRNSQVIDIPVVVQVEVVYPGVLLVKASFKGLKSL